MTSCSLVYLCQRLEIHAAKIWSAKELVCDAVSFGLQVVPMFWGTCFVKHQVRRVNTWRLMIWMVDMDVSRNLLAWNLGYDISVMISYSLAGRYRHFQKYNFLNFRYKFTRDVTRSGTWLRTFGVTQDKTVRSWYRILWLLGTDVSGNYFLEHQDLKIRMWCHVIFQRNFLHDWLIV